MKWLKAVGGLLIIGGFVYGVWYAKTNKVEVPFVGMINLPVPVKDGQEIQLVLLTPLDSGGSEVGKEVQLVVAKNVVVNGKVVIPVGSIATAKVSRSRAGTLLGAVTNQPARLEIDLEEVTVADGKKAKIRAHAPGEPFEITQEVVKPEEGPNAIELVSDPEARNLLVSMSRQMVLGEKQSQDQVAKANESLGELAKKYNLENTTTFLSGKAGKTAKKQNITELFENIQKGDLQGLAGPESVLAIRAAGEIVELGASVDRSLRGIFKGNNIHAPTGTAITAYLAESVKVKVPGENK